MSIVYYECSVSGYDLVLAHFEEKYLEISNFSIVYINANFNILISSTHLYVIMFNLEPLKRFVLIRFCYYDVTNWEVSQLLIFCRLYVFHSSFVCHTESVSNLFYTEVFKTADGAANNGCDEQNMLQNHVTHADDVNNTHCNGGDLAYLKKRLVVPLSD